jgi:hypothetical protein
MELAERRLRVFLSWSGPRSRAVAAALREWLPDILHFVDPWMSDTDINAGQRWGSEIGKTLAESNFGILCVTQENLAAPWLLFEAGALSKSLTQAAVIPLLLDVNFSDINNGPLGQFQAKKVSKDGCYELVSAINTYSENPIDSARLARNFERAWPDLEDRIERIPAAPARTIKEQRPTNEVLEDILAGMSRIEGRLVWEGESDSPADDLFLAINRERVDRLRHQLRQEVENRSLRSVAEEVGITPMGLRGFILELGNLQESTVRRLFGWMTIRQDERERAQYWKSVNKALPEDLRTKGRDTPSNPDEETP